MSNSKSITKVVEIRGQQAFTTSLVVAEWCELEHRAVIQLIRKYIPDFEELGRVAFEMRPFATTGGTQRRELAILNEDQATYLVTLFKNSPIVRKFKLRLVKEFRAAINEIARLNPDPPRSEILVAKRKSNRPMMDALVEARHDAGKETCEHHYITEARLCNWVVTGKFEGIPESALSNEEAALLEKVRDRNRAYLLSGLDYETRKARLVEFAIRARTKRIESNPAL